MANCVSLLARRRIWAEEAVEHWILDNVSGARRLTAGEIRAYSTRRVVAGWRLCIHFPEGGREVDLLLCDRFPWSVPKVALVDKSNFLRLPHVEPDGILCVFPGHAEVNPFTPVDSVRHVLAAAARLIEDCASGARDDDFRAEIRSYWPTDDRAPHVRSIINPTGPTRIVHVWRGKEFYLVGDEPASVERWLDHYSAGHRVVKPAIEEGVLLWQDQAILPIKYPRTAADVLKLAQGESEEGEALLQHLAAKAPEKVVVLIGAKTAHGPGLVGVIIDKPRAESRGPRVRGSNPLTRGFRRGKMPSAVTATHYLGGSKVLRSSVERADAAWVHGRGSDPRQPRLQASSATLVGCGSLGAPIAVLLAQAGVGRLILIDPDWLTSANVGRHTLGAGSVYKPKVTALAERLRRDYPHIREVIVRHSAWEDVARESPELLASSDLVVSTVGSWGAEGPLNEWHLKIGRFPPVIYGWTEANACAGQGVMITANSGCFACGLSPLGVPRLQVTKWPMGVSQHQEPACGAVYQPYGPVELSHVVAMIADMALDSILGQVSSLSHRVWCARRSVLEGLGGLWTAEWQGIAKGRGDGGFIAEMPWAIHSSCATCQRDAA